MPYLIVKNRDRKLFEGDVDTITSYNKKGIFDILVDHANFISLIEKKIIIRKSGSQEEIVVENGLVKTIQNKIYIYLGIK